MSLKEPGIEGRSRVGGGWNVGELIVGEEEAGRGETWLSGKIDEQARERQQREHWLGEGSGPGSG